MPLKDKLIVWLVAMAALTFAALIIIAAIVMRPETPAPQVIPTQMMCIDGTGYYRPATGGNYIILADEACR